MHQISGHKVLHVNLSDSTNNLMNQWIEANGPTDGLVIKSDFQSAGKGMMHNSWESDAGQNLLFSLCFEAQNMKIDDQFYISKVMAISLVNALNNFLGEDICLIKWPNDILLNKRKVCGILIQNSIKNEKLQHAVIGIGVNVNQQAFKSNPNAHSLSKHRGSECDIDGVLEHILTQWDIFSKMLKPIDREVVDRIYHELLYGYDTWLNYSQGKQSFQGKIQKVRPNGHLVLEKKGNVTEEYDLKEISLAEA